MASKVQASKRKAPAPTKARDSKKAKKTQPAPSPSPAFDSDEAALDFGDDGDSDEGSSAGDLDAAPNRATGKGRAAEEDEEDEEDDEEDFDEEDSEVNEFELEEEREDEDLIGDDDEDLMAGLDSQDDEEDDDEDDDDDDAPAPPPVAIKKANIRNSKAPAPLKPAELRALAFAELTASPISNIISTQVSTLLTPLTPPAPSTSPLQPLLRSLHAHITSLPAQKASNLAGLRKKGVVVPKVEGSDGKWGKPDLEWEKPNAEDVRIVGRWAWGASLKVKGEYVVDMAVGMPASLLQPKDYLSPRFLVKSTHYLVVLASLLPSSLGPLSLSYVALPASLGWALEIRAADPKAADKVGLAKIKGAVLRLRIVWPADAFPAAKISPSSNVARASSTTNQQLAPSALAPTPLHSSSLHFSSLFLLTSHLKFHHTLTVSHPSYTSAVRLLQSWAAKRSYGASLGLSDEWWAWCVARTLDWGAGSSAGAGAAVGGEAWAGWRKAVEWLAGINWTDGVWFRVEGDKAYPKDEFRTAFAGRPIFVDPTGTVNLAAGIELSTLEMIKQDAKSTIALLLTNVEDEQKFEGAFLRDIRACERFDNYARITIPDSLLSATSEDKAALDHASPLAYLISNLSATLHRALGTRAKAFQLTVPSPASLPVKGTPPATEPLVLTLGLLLDSAQAGRLVDQGPSAEDEAACTEFRAFWGAKSELRRFKDGAIVESVVWEEPSQGGLGQQRNKVVSQIVEYVLESRHGIPKANVDVFAGAMDHLLVEPGPIRRAIFLEDSVANNKGFGNIMGAFDAIAKELKELPELPLEITAIQPSSAGLRYSTIFTPSPRRLKNFEQFPDSTKYIEVHDILLTLEGSGRWPDDLEGVQKIKAAFLAKMAEGLSGLHSIFKADVVFDLEARTLDDNVSLEILTATGFAFRARIYYERSLMLLQRRNAQLGLSTSVVDSPLDLYNERFVHAPRHHAALATLQHHFTSYSPTVRLVKRWFSSHMLSPSFPAELIEILSASVFVDPSSPYEVPHSGATGFARVMEKLASWNWRDEPLVVALYSFSNATTAGRRPAFPTLAKAIAVAAFQEQRLSDPQVAEYAWKVCTEEDPAGKVWGRRTGKVVAGRVRGLARATLKAMNEGLVAGGLEVEQLFSPPLGDYNFLIHLGSSVVPRHFQSLSPDPKALSRPRSSILSGTVMGELEEGAPVRLGWDPVSDFVRDVERQYPSTFLLFFSPDGSPVIGGIWNPTTEGPRQWKVGLGFPARPVDVTGEESGSKAKVVLDKEAVLREVERLGAGLVKRIEVVGVESA